MRISSLVTKRRTHCCALLIKTAIWMLGVVFLSACSDDDDDDSTPAPASTARYEITVTNISANQPLSPFAVTLHDGTFMPWEIGSPASDGLEQLAEGGDNTAWLMEAETAGAYAATAATAAIGPGESSTVNVETSRRSSLYLSLATMLVNTNDAFTGTETLDLSGLSRSGELRAMLPVYDAGTEANNELAGTIPGPADGGEGFNANRDDVDYVARHPGVVSQDDGYSSSVLNGSHRFDNPVAKLVVRRL